MPTQGIWIETERLLLRTVCLEDITAVAGSWNLDGPALPLSEAEAVTQRMLDNHAGNTPGHLLHLCLAIVAKESQSMIGWCGLDGRDPSQPAPVLFYLLKQKWWGKGCATEAARALLAYAFETLALERIDAAAQPYNLASKRIMEKLGMRFLGNDEVGGYRLTISREEMDLATDLHR